VEAEDSEEEGQKQAWRREAAEQHERVGEVLMAGRVSLVPSTRRTDDRQVQMQERRESTPIYALSS
jgi:hypothetical protein